MSEVIGGLRRDRPVLLIADFGWDAQGGGAVILKSLIGDAIGNGLIWVTPGKREQDLERGHYGLGTAEHAHFSNIINAGRLAREIEALAKRVHASAYWTVMHGSTVAIAGHLAATSGLPIHVTVHDDPIHATALRSRRMFLLAPLLARHFRRAMRAAKSIDVVGHGMAARYTRKFGVQCDILHRALDVPVPPAVTFDLSRQGLCVGVLGNTYSYRQLPILAAAVEQAAREIQAPPRIVVCGAGHGDRLKKEFAGRVEVEVTQHLAEPQAIERLRTCLALYLNYPFGWQSRVLRETSFPTKLTTYIYTARPLLVHAPPGTSVSNITRERGYVTPWLSLDVNDGARLLVEMARNPASASGFPAEAEQVRRTYYDPDRHRATLDRILCNLVHPR